MKNINISDDELNNEEKLQNVFNDLRHDFTQAKDAKTEIDDLITGWNDLYYGTKRDASGEPVIDKRNKSGIVMREIAKQIEWQKPNITEPFVSTKSPIELTGMKDGNKARVLEKWANYEFTQEFDRDFFINQATDVVLREGTVWVQTSWETEEENVRTIIPNASMEELMNKSYEPTDIEQNSDGTYKVEYNEIIQTMNNPDATVMRNEHVFPDPTARTMKELRFVAVIKLLTISDIRKISVLDSKQIDILENKLSSEEREDTGLGVSRNDNASSYGYDNDYEPQDTPRKHIRIVEYWGYYDLNNDGIPEPIVAYFPESYKNINLGVEENPFPHKGIPFDSSVYSARPFSLWGNPLAFFLGDNQKVRNGIVRGILDNMSLANNNQKFILRGTLDYVNFKRMNNGERHIIINKADSITDGSYNQLPNSVFNTLEMFKKEDEDLSGVSGNGPSLGNSGVAKDGQQAQLTMSQQRMASLVRNLSNLLRKIISKWIMMGEVFLTDNQIIELFEENEQVNMNVFAGSQKTKIKVNVGTEVNRNMKLQQYNMLMQQAKTLEGELPPGSMKEMVAEMYDLFDMHDAATKLRLYQPQPSPEQQAAQQLQIKNAELENAKIEMEIAVMQKDVEARYINAQARMMDANANVGYKDAQSYEKMTKAQGHQVDSAMKPVQVENEIMKTNTDAMNNGKKEDK